MRYLIVAPIALSLLRAIAAPFIVALAASGGWLFSFLILMGAAVTDWLDGWIAIRFRLGTAFGGKLDPACDSIMMAGAIGGLVFGGFFHWTILLLFIASLIAIGLVQAKIPETKALRRNANRMAAFGYLGILIIVAWLYAYLAFGNQAIWLALIAMPVIFFASKAKKERIVSWIQGTS